MAQLFFERLRDYFQGIADALADWRDASAIFLNTSDAGAAREDLLARFLETHLPRRCEVIKGGFVFNDQGNESSQIDLIVTNDLTLRFRQLGGARGVDKSFNCVEGCYAAISVKTMLNKAALVNSIENLASIPEAPEPKISPLLKASEGVRDLPIRIVFAFSGMKHNTLLDHIKTFYEGNDVPENRKLSMIVVNNAYYVVRLGEKGGKTRDGQVIPPFTYYAQGWDSKYIGGYALMSMVTEIQLTSNYGPHMLQYFGRYLDQLPLD